MTVREYMRRFWRPDLYLCEVSIIAPPDAESGEHHRSAKRGSLIPLASLDEPFHAVAVCEVRHHGERLHVCAHCRDYYFKRREVAA